MNVLTRWFVLSFLVLLACGLSAASSPEEPPRIAGTDVPAPKLERSIAPVYPPEAEARGLGGVVIVAVIIDEQGQVASAEIVRGIPGLDEAALAAVRQWRFAVTKADGAPVRVRHVVSVSFTHRLPRVTRARDVPELRQGVAPRFPDVTAAEKTSVATITLLVDENGLLSAVGLESGTPPWTNALLAAVQTWRFSAEPGRSPLALRLEARFVLETRSVDLHLGLHTPQAKGTEQAAAEETVVSEALSSPEGIAPNPSAVQAEPPTDSEVVPGAIPPPASTPPPPGISAVDSVVLGPGVPDLILGRRPVVPPLARVEGLSGAIKIVFSVDVDGHTTVHNVEGPENLRAAAEGVVRSWTFRPLTAGRIFLMTTIAYDAQAISAVATVGRRDIIP